MNDTPIDNIPGAYNKIKEVTKALDFQMASDLYTGSLLKTLAASKKRGHFLELGTGTGFATVWIVDGMDEQSELISVENNSQLIEVAKKYIQDTRVNFIQGDAYKWIPNYTGRKFDFIFADAMPGKYDFFDETIDLLEPGGLYIIDDMLTQSNWPAGHDKKVGDLINKIEQRSDLSHTKMSWSTGIIIVSKK